jgi:hypothetical protein
MADFSPFEVRAATVAAGRYVSLSYGQAVGRAPTNRGFRWHLESRTMMKQNTATIPQENERVVRTDYLFAE